MDSGGIERVRAQMSRREEGEGVAPMNRRRLTGDDEFRRHPASGKEAVTVLIEEKGKNESA